MAAETTVEAIAEAQTQTRNTNERERRRYTGFEKQYIAGTWRHGRARGVNRDGDPFTGDVLVEIPNASADDLDEAYRAAAQAQKAWAQRLPGERAAVLRKAAEIFEARHDEIVEWLIHEAGSTRIKALLEWEAVHGVLLEAIALPHMVEGRILPADVPGKESRVYRKPVGVVGVISPWNFPLQLTARSIFPALAVGNACVVKPASDTPITGGLFFARVLEEAGLPAGTLSVVVGAGKDIGDAFVTHAIPRVISFTGSTDVGRHIAKLAADAPVLKKLELELGGNSPFVVLDDADLERAVEAAVFGKFFHQGQICMIANRFIVDDAVYDEFVDAFAERVRALKYGDPSDHDTVIGPIINDSQLRTLQKKIAAALNGRVRAVVGGDATGQVLPPHVFVDVDNDDAIAREEIFGPLAPIIRVHGEDEALRVANDTGFGLSSCVFTEDLERGERFAMRLEAGMSHVNDQTVNDLPFSPFGGEKNSGIGRFNGRWALRAFTTDHWVTVQHAPREYPQNARVLAGPWGGG